MEIQVLDSNFDTVDELDVYKSFIWTDRFNEYGDFEVYTPCNSEVLEMLTPDRYLWCEKSDKLMIIEDIDITTDTEDGVNVKVTGKSLESILYRRIVWEQTDINGNLQDGIERLLNENLISPTDQNRQIPNFVFDKSEDERITELTLEAQYTGDDLYSVIADICKDKDIGFKITLDDDKKFHFCLYLGVDRTYGQDKVPYVEFSPDFDNIINGEYVESKSTLKTVAAVLGAGEGTARKRTVTGDETITGINRRELYVDARDIQEKDDNGNTISDSEYQNKLVQRGNEKLAENKISKVYDGEVEATQQYRYGEHFDMGDVVQLGDGYGRYWTARITEYIMSEDTDGNKYYPTFTIMENEKN